jgi:hypothetical protein
VSAGGSALSAGVVAVEVGRSGAAPASVGGADLVNSAITVLAAMVSACPGASVGAGVPGAGIVQAPMITANTRVMARMSGYLMIFSPYYEYVNGSVFIILLITLLS